MGTNIVHHDGCGIGSTNDVSNMNMISLKCGVGFVHRKQELEVGAYPYQGVAQDDDKPPKALDTQLAIFQLSARPFATPHHTTTPRYAAFLPRHANLTCRHVT